MDAPAGNGTADGDMRKKIMAIQMDKTLTDAQKARKRQELMAGKWMVAQAADDSSDEDEDAGAKHKGKAAAANGKETTIFDETLKCAMCMELCNRPITAPCQHNFCLGCFNKWVAQGKKTCPTCRHPFPAKWAANPRINTALTSAIRMAKLGERPAAARAVARINDKDRPDEAFTTDRAVRAGRANAASGRIMVTVPGDHFGPIPPEADPRGLGVRVGEHWKDRLDCRQWGAHFPHVAGIAGQSGQGAQSVVLSGGYEDDRDEGEWFLYTGSGGRDLSGNKRVTSVQSFDQTFEKMNKALLMSCQKGLPVRVVRSAKEKRSAYAPGEDQPVRYDGIYRIARAYRKPGAQGKLVCRYLFIRCDNEPAPWSSEDTGDQPWDVDLPAEALTEIKAAKGTVCEMGAKPWWDWDEKKKEWGWARPAPVSTRSNADPSASPKKLRRKASEHERALRDFMCKLCKCVLTEPLSTPCGHHFCKPCLAKKFEGLGEADDRAVNAGRTMRVRKVVKPCPACKADIAEFLAHGQVNRGMIEVIAKLQAAARKAQADAAALEAGGAAAGEDDDAAATNDAEAEAEAEAELEAAVEGAGGGPAPTGIAADPADEGAAGPSEPREPAAAAPAQSTAPAAAPDSVAGASVEEMAALAADFPEFDGALLAGMVEDQGGDIAEVRAGLRRMRNQTAAAERKAKRAAGTAAVKDAKPKEPMPRPAARGRPAKKAKKAAEGGTSGKGTEDAANRALYASVRDMEAQARLEAEAVRRAVERAALEQRLNAAAAEVLRRQGRLSQFRAAVGWNAEELAQWAAAAAQKEEDAAALAAYQRQDEARVRDLSMALERRDAAIQAAGERFAERNAALRDARTELDTRARELASEEDAHRQVETRIAALERGVARQRSAYRAQQAALAAALDDIERLKNTLEAASDGLAAERSAAGHAQQQHASAEAQQARSD
ncbi:hypothetical protein WJX81_002222 [Elliptochloris bilobata]|uniref:RING-type E3 ubiquitin transferase n=1 Tax=Elliptochloris bilobata TaxID=381761 RepID=A0AAW1SLE3_9CHLO